MSLPNIPKPVCAYCQTDRCHLARHDLEACACSDPRHGEREPDEGPSDAVLAAFGMFDRGAYDEPADTAVLASYAEFVFDNGVEFPIYAEAQ